jgi:hypothetical protein
VWGGEGRGWLSQRHLCGISRVPSSGLGVRTAGLTSSDASALSCGTVTELMTVAPFCCVGLGGGHKMMLPPTQPARHSYPLAHLEDDRHRRFRMTPVQVEGLGDLYRLEMTTERAPRH